jgi:hypothetical protein
MATPNKKPQNQAPVQSDKCDLRQHGGRFNLDFLDPQVPLIMSYQDVLLTAEEKAAYFEDLARNNGVENFAKIVKDCRARAAKLKEKVSHIDPDEALPLLEKIAGLESLADYYADPTPPEVEESRKTYGNTLSIPLTPEQRDGLVKMGLTVNKPSSKSDVGQKDADDPDLKRGQEFRKKAAFWKNIHSWNAIEQLAYYHCEPVKKPADWTEAVFVRAQKDRYAVNLLAREARYPMMRLLELAEMGNEDAVKAAVEELERFVRLLNLSAKTNPEVFKKVAGKMQSWPVMYSSHPRLNQIPERIAKQIGLGADIDFEFSSNTKWNPKDTGCKIAINLYLHIKKMRQYPASNKYSQGFAEALNLPDIKQSTAAYDWWGVAKAILLNSFPKPEENEVLRGLTKIKDRFKVRDKILECIENRFISLFPKEFRDKREPLSGGKSKPEPR